METTKEQIFALLDELVALPLSLAHPADVGRERGLLRERKASEEGSPYRQFSSLRP